jgi:hypothetical protein
MLPSKGLKRVRVLYMPVSSRRVLGSRAVLLIVKDYLRRRFARCKLCAHFLDLRCLFLERCCEGLNFLLLLCGIRLKVLPLLRDGRFLFCHCGL